MRIIRHPKLSEDIRVVAMHYAEISERILLAFWNELDAAISSVENNPGSHHLDFCGLRRANLKRFPYHLLYDFENDSIFMIVFRHNKGHPGFGIERKT